MAGVDTATAHWLATPAGRQAIEAAGAHGHDPLAAAAALRRDRPDLAPGQASAALEQAGLRRLAHERYGIDARRLLLTRAGLEQATRPQVAARRATLLRASGVRRVLDLTAGLGFDAAACAAAGLAVRALERDPVTAALCRHNWPQVEVVDADATDPGALAAELARLAPTDAVFADPARRDPDGPRDARLRAVPERDPARWAPPWPWLAALPHPRVAAKVAPSLAAPAGWHAEWSSVHRVVVECAVYSWPAFAEERRAVVWAGGEAAVVPAGRSDLPAPADELGAWLHEPDPAVVKAGAVATLLAGHPRVRPLGPHSTWLTGPDEWPGPAARAFEVIGPLDGSVREQRRRLDGLAVAALTVKSRDTGVAPATVLRELGRREGPGHVVVLTRMGDRSIRVLCRPARGRPA